MKQAIKNTEECVDTIIQSFWKNGYLTLSRKYGTYLPAPPQVGEYEIDAIGKQRNKFALGLVLSNKDLDDQSIYKKIEFLASRQSKFTNKRVTLFIGIPKGSENKAKLIIRNLNLDLQKNIKLVSIPTMSSSLTIN